MDGAQVNRSKATEIVLPNAAAASDAIMKVPPVSFQRGRSWMKAESTIAAAFFVLSEYGGLHDRTMRTRVHQSIRLKHCAGSANPQQSHITA
jgi:hypothetical protein